jgi:hypothetical protein
MIDSRDLKITNADGRRLERAIKEFDATVTHDINAGDMMHISVGWEKGVGFFVEMTPVPSVRCELLRGAME